MLASSWRLYSASWRAGGDEFGVAVAHVAALGELVVDVAFGAVVAHEFHFAA